MEGMMRWLWLPILLVLGGCSITIPSSPPPIRASAPAGAAALPPEIVSVKQSVVRFSGRAPACFKRIEGTGFVYAPQRVVTAAHVVAGVTRSFSVTTDDGEVYPARVVVFDPSVDVAVLYVPDLSAPPLVIADAPPGDAYALAYPKGAEREVVQPIKIERHIGAESLDIYEKRKVTKEVLELSGANIAPGWSGAPLVVPGGTVTGMVFAQSKDAPNRGYALAAEEFLFMVNDARYATRPVSTQQCSK
ncbi:trypsin-like serine protease [Microbispora catharanthi]|uniref:Trypsin-like serine protease n=2 Tax=Microbispora catharanthi TaxID=1712871 RepID=A0A5N6BWG6_9ACTN|nr:trypsin-like serine protease [Microbispora catharanthi]